MNFSKNNIFGTTFTIFASIGFINAMELQPVDDVPVWVATSDQRLMTIPQWQINQMETLQILSLEREIPTSYNNPIEASNTTSTNLKLMQNALTAAKTPQEFNMFYDNLKEYDQRQLLVTSYKVKATQISSLINKIKWAPEKMQNRPIITSQLTEVANELVTTKPKKNLNEPIVTLPSEEILHARLTEHGFIDYQELVNKLKNVTASVSDIVVTIDLILTNKHLTNPKNFTYLLMFNNLKTITRLILQDNQNAIAFLEKKGIL